MPPYHSVPPRVCLSVSAIAAVMIEGMHAERIVGHKLHGGMPSYRSLGASTLNLPLARDETLSRSQHTNPIGVR